MQQSFQRSNGTSFTLSNNSSSQPQPQQQIKHQPQQQLLKRQNQTQTQTQTQPLSVSQTTNIQQQQQYREALLARAKLNSSKSFNLEDDLEFYPNPIDTRPTINTRGFLQGPLSPYSTPTKMSSLNSHRMNSQHSGYISPRLMDSPQQQSQHLHHSHQQIFSSPQAGMVRRLDIPSSSMYQHSPSRNW